MTLCSPGCKDCSWKQKHSNLLKYFPASLGLTLNEAVPLIGTLELFNCDADRAWREIHKSNMAKEPGANKSRKNPFGLPDMVKPEGWKEPEILKYDCGILPDIFESEKERLQMLREKRDLENEFKGQVANSQYE